MSPFRLNGKKKTLNDNKKQFSIGPWCEQNEPRYDTTKQSYGTMNAISSRRTHIIKFGISIKLELWQIYFSSMS